ncbi:MAG: hypothetical protein KA153_02975 [Hyphomonadaceae bacterium]|jgi:hypothetical protein|nr:hypothetical protein [Hyphomonadaceae bacterium]
MSEQRKTSTPRSGVTGVLFVFCLAALIAGLAFDLAGGVRVHFWIGDQPGAAAAVGVAVVLFVVLAGQAARFVLGRWDRVTEGSDDGSSHT